MKRNWLLKIMVCFCLLFLGSKSSAQFFRWKPTPLLELVQKSQYIAVGYVAEISDISKPKFPNGAKNATVAILEILQGEPPTLILNIEYSADDILPTSVKFIENSYAIVFLKNVTDSNIYETYGGIYGSKTLTFEEITIYKDRISELQEILKIADKRNRELAKTEWLVRCIENDITRWEGSYVLENSKTVALHSLRIPSYKDNLTISHYERIKKSIFTSNGSVDIYLIDLLYKNNEAEIDSFLLAKLKTLREEDYWSADKFIHRLKHKSNENKTNNILKEFEKIKYSTLKTTEIKKLIDAFIKTIEN